MKRASYSSSNSKQHVLLLSIYTKLKNNTKQKKDDDTLKYIIGVKEWKGNLTHIIGNTYSIYTTTQQFNSHSLMYAIWLTTWLHARGTNLDIKGLLLISSTQQWFLIQTRSPLLNVRRPLIPPSEPVIRLFQHIDTKGCMT